MLISIACPLCGQEGIMPRRHRSRLIHCPICGGEFALSDIAPPNPTRMAAPQAEERFRDQPRPRSALGLFLLGAACTSLLVVAASAGLWYALARPQSPGLTPEPTVLAHVEPAPPPAAAPAPAPAPAPVVIPEAAPATVPTPDPEPTELTTEQIAARAEGSVAMVWGKRTVGTGFLVRPGLLVTNAHVLENEFFRDVRVRFPSAPKDQQGPIQPVLRYEDLTRDLAVLAVDTRLKPLELAQSYAFRRGQDVTVIGNPGVATEDGGLTLENAVIRGVLGSQVTMEDLLFYQLSASINPGNSGGPALDATGEVIGLATRKAAREEGLAFCIPVEDLHVALSRAISVSIAQTDRAASQHDRALVLRILEKGQGLYVEALRYHVEVHKRTLMKLAIVVESRAAAKLIDAQVAAFERAYLQDLEVEVVRLSNDPLLPLDARESLVELWSVQSQMRHLLKPKGLESSDIEAASIKLGSRQKTLMTTLRASMGVEIPFSSRPLRVAGMPDGFAILNASMPASPPLSLQMVELRSDRERVGGYAKVYGTVKNTSDQDLKNIVATVQVKDPRDRKISQPPARVKPEVIHPGQNGTFFIRVPLYSLKDRYAAEFATESGLPIRAE